MPKNRAVSGIIFLTLTKLNAICVVAFHTGILECNTRIIFPISFVTIATSGQREFRLRKKQDLKGRRWSQEQQQSCSTEDVPR